MKLCVRKSDNKIINDIQTGHPFTWSMQENAVRTDGGKPEDYYCISVAHREFFRSIMPSEAFEIYEYIKSSELKEYLQFIHERPYEDVDPLWLRNLKFKDGTHPIYKLYANKTLKRIKQVTAVLNGWVFRAKRREIGKDGKLYITLSDEDAKKLGAKRIQPESFATKNTQFLLVEKDTRRMKCLDAQ